MASPVPPASPSASTLSTTSSTPAPPTRVAGSAIMFGIAKLYLLPALASPASLQFFFAPEQIPSSCSPSFLPWRVFTSVPRSHSKIPSPPSSFPRNSTAWPSAPSPPSTPSATLSPASSSASSGASSTYRLPSPPPRSYSSSVLY